MQENKQTVESKIFYTVLIIVSFLAPIFFIPVDFISTQFGTSLLFSFGVLLSLFLYVFFGLKNGYVYLPASPVKILSIIFIIPIVYTLSGFSGGFSRLAFFGYTFDIGTVGFIILSFFYLFLISIYFNSKTRIFYAYLSFVISSLILAIFIILRIIFGVDFLSFGLFNQISSTVLGNWNNVGIFFGIGVVLSILTFEMVNISGLMKALIILSLLLSIFFLALVNFQIIWYIVSACSIILILYFSFGSRDGEVENFSIKKVIKNIPILTSIILALSIVFILNGNEIGQYISTKLNVTNLEVKPSFSMTFDIAKNTIKENPLLGSGPNTFNFQWLALRPADVVSTIFWNIDFSSGIGLIPTFAVTTGLLGLLSWAVFFGFLIYLGIKSIFQKNLDGFIRYLLVSSFFVSAYLWIMSFVYVLGSVIFIMNMFFTGLFLATAYISGSLEVKKSYFTRNPKTGFLASIVLVSIFVGSISLAFGLYKNSKSLLYFQKSSHALNSGNNADLSEEYMLKAINLVPQDIYYRALSEIELLKMSQIVSQNVTDANKAEIQKQFSDTLSNAIKAALASEKADPQNYLNWISAGRIYESVSSPEMKIENAFESAESHYKQALKLNPKNPSILILLSRLSVTNGDLKKARDYALDAISLKRNYIDAYFILSQIEVLDNNIRGAIQSATAASIIDPTNPATFFQLGLLKYNSRDFTGAIGAFESAISIVPDYASAKYFLGLSYVLTGQRQKAINEFRDLKSTNPGNTEVENILSNLESGKSVFDNSVNPSPEKSKKLPVEQTDE